MSVARDRVVVALPPAAALELWLDTARWPTFVDGLARVDRHQGSWPEPGTSVMWHSRPGGRGTVTAKVLELERPAHVVLQVFEDRLTGRETATFAPDPGGALVDVALDYELTGRTPGKAIADFIFIRRALRDSIRRTLERFAIEAAEDAALAADAPI